MYMNTISEYCENKNVFKFLVGNKCDLEQDRRITYDDLLQKAEEHNCKGFETSTMPEFTSTIDELLNEVIEQLADRIDDGARLNLGFK